VDFAIPLMYMLAMTKTSAEQIHVADAVRGSWLMQALPETLIPYAQLARLDRPIGWWLLLLPCWWSLTLGQIAGGGGVPSLWFALLFFIGAIAMRGAGCVMNDLADRDIDAKVERTKSRPLPSGRVSVKQALAFMAAQLLIGLGVLLQFNRYTIVLALASMAIVAIYPFMKRITYWPQLVLGLAFNWGALVGWSAAMGGLSAAPLWMYAGGVFWTLAYTDRCEVHCAKIRRKYQALAHWIFCRCIDLHHNCTQCCGRWLILFCRTCSSGHACQLAS
jgi:4-hydroxybenzoate polyprenyltransferase